MTRRQSRLKFYSEPTPRDPAHTSCHHRAEGNAHPSGTSRTAKSRPADILSPRPRCKRLIPSPGPRLPKPFALPRAVKLYEVDPDTPLTVAPPTPPAWQRVLLARHPKRPHSLDYVERLLTDFQEIHGDRSFADDPAIVSGMAQFEGRPVMLVRSEEHT